MNPQLRPFLVVAALVVLAGALAYELQSTPPGAGSVRSRTSDGWLAARRYLEARGRAVELLDKEIGDWPRDGVVVTALPWSHGLPAEPLHELRSRVFGGLTLVVSYTGSDTDVAEERLLESLGLTPAAARERPSLWPWRFRQWAREEWELRRPGPNGAALRIRAPARIPVAPLDARALLLDGRDRALAFEAAVGRGRVIALPAEVFSNGRLGAAGHADLLETLLATADRWAFDEFHHGLRPLQAGAGGPAARSFDLLLAHLAFLYALTALALVRRHGPAWREEATRSGSASALLVGLGGLHRRLGHQPEAAARLLRRTAELFPGTPLPPLPRGKVDLLALARQVAQARRR